MASMFSWDMKVCLRVITQVWHECLTVRFWPVVLFGGRTGTLVTDYLGSCSHKSEPLSPASIAFLTSEIDGAP